MTQPGTRAPKGTSASAEPLHRNRAPPGPGAIRPTTRTKTTAARAHLGLSAAEVGSPSRTAYVVRATGVQVTRQATTPNCVQAVTGAREAQATRTLVAQAGTRTRKGSRTVCCAQQASSATPRTDRWSTSTRWSARRVITVWTEPSTRRNSPVLKVGVLALNNLFE